MKDVVSYVTYRVGRDIFMCTSKTHLLVRHANDRLDLTYYGQFMCSGTKGQPSIADRRVPVEICSSVLNGIMVDAI